MLNNICYCITNNIICCMCEQKFILKDCLIPQKCLSKYGKKSHRICQDCWWDTKIGFSREDGNHDCPGCKKGLPIN